jgi:hypothetical protein
VYEWFGSEHAGREAQQPRARAAFVGLIQRARQNLLFNAFRIAPWRHPSAIHVEDVEFVMFFC